MSNHEQVRLYGIECCLMVHKKSRKRTLMIEMKVISRQIRVYFPKETFKIILNKKSTKQLIIAY